MSKKVPKVREELKSMEVNPILEELSKAPESLKRSLVSLCKHFLKGECPNQDLCPDLHQLPDISQEAMDKLEFYVESNPHDQDAKQILSKFKDKKQKEQKPLPPPGPPPPE